MTKVSNRDQMLYDIFTTAMEGGIGYWSQCTKYQLWEPNTTVAAIHGFFATIVDDAEGDYDTEIRIDRSVITKGLTLATTEWRNKLAWSSEKPPFIIAADTDWDYDAGDADLIVQLGLFGDVRYG